MGLPGQYRQERKAPYGSRKRAHLKQLISQLAAEDAKLVWLIDFVGYSRKNAPPVKVRPHGQRSPLWLLSALLWELA